MAHTSFHLLLFLLFGLLFMEVGGEVSGVRCIERDRDALLKFKQGTQDPSNRLSSWLNGDDCCRWTGVRCSNITGHVVGLDLRNRYQTVEWYDFLGRSDVAVDRTKSLGGQISDSLLTLQSLRYLDLSFNDFGEIPIPEFFGSFRELQYLNLSNAKFSGSVPNQLGNLSNLHFLDLNDINRPSFYVQNPCLYVQNLDWLSRLSSLKYLDMSGINLDGTFDWLRAVNHLPSLVELHLVECELGAVSSPITYRVNFTSLKILDLSFNEHIDSLAPTWLLNGITSHLVYLSLSFNWLPGPIPEVFNITSLQHLDLSYNPFQGPIGDALGNLISLEYLDLHENQFQGPIGDTLGNLTSLEYLDLSCNQFQGPIGDTLGNITSLEYLVLSQNQFQGPIGDTLGNLTSLDLSENQFQGPIGDTLGNLTSLEYLDLSWNQFQGPIGDTLGNLTSLEHLDLHENQFHGFIPDGLGKILSLNFLDLSWNALEGGIPRTFGDLCNLQKMYLDSNNLGGDLSWNLFSGCFTEDLGNFSSLKHLSLRANRLIGTLPVSIGQLSQLIFLDVSKNSLHGTISETHSFNLTRLRYLDISFTSLVLNLSANGIPPFQPHFLYMDSCPLGPQTPAWLKMQKSLSVLHISNTGIKYVPPNWFWNFSSHMEIMDISSNQIYGKLPHFSQMSNLPPVAIDLSSNHLHGAIPKISPNITSLNLSNNSISGTISDFLCSGTGSPNMLKILDLSKNFLFGEISDCWMYWLELRFLDLSYNDFSGEIPSSISCLYWLQSLHLQNNNLSGELPSSLKNCTWLITLDIGENNVSGNIPPWVGESLLELTFLRMRSNLFEGNIPSQLCLLTKIQIFDLAQNKLCGIIPLCLNNLTFMAKNITTMGYDDYGYGIGENMEVYWKGRDFEYQRTVGLMMSIDLSSNILSGEIPAQIMSLSFLKSLNLSRNRLTGTIPKTIGHLVQLESLDFSRNCLSGVIPTELSNISFLSHLDLSNNNLSGSIPLGTQLQSFNESAFMGNLKLCGPPLLVNCTVNGNSNKPGPHRAHEDDEKVPGLYIAIAVGYITGVWVAFGSLLFSRSWRHAYFKFVEEAYDCVFVIIVVNTTKLKRKLGILQVHE